LLELGWYSAPGNGPKGVQLLCQLLDLGGPFPLGLDDIAPEQGDFVSCRLELFTQLRATTVGARPEPQAEKDKRKQRRRNGKPNGVRLGYESIRLGD
jgi:hypothetical protein